MKYIVEDELLKSKGIQIEDEIVKNGEERLRIKLPDYSAIHITEASKTPSWQNAHFHKHSKEIYVVLFGKILIATKKGATVNYITLNKGEEIIIEPSIEHNVYMYENSKTIVVKYGNTRESDWNEAKEFDELTRSYDI